MENSCEEMKFVFLILVTTIGFAKGNLISKCFSLAVGFFFIMTLIILALILLNFMNVCFNNIFIILNNNYHRANSIFYISRNLVMGCVIAGIIFLSRYFIIGHHKMRKVTFLARKHILSLYSKPGVSNSEWLTGLI